MEAQTDKAKLLIQNDRGLYLDYIDRSGDYWKAETPFRDQVAALGAALANSESSATLINDLLELAWEVGLSQGIAESAVAFDVGWLMGHGLREKALERLDELPAEIAETIESMSSFERTAGELEKRIAGSEGATVTHLVPRDDGGA